MIRPDNGLNCVEAPWPTPDREIERLAEVDAFHASNLPEAGMTAIAELACEMLDAPIALISLVYDDHCTVKARVGTDLETLPRQIAFCSHTILSDDALDVADLRLDERFKDNPLVTGPAQTRFYAGVPLRTARGFNIGSLCVMDTQARAPLTTKQKHILKRLSTLVLDTLELRRSRESAIIAAKFVDATAEAFLCVGHDGIITAWNAGAEHMFGLPQSSAIGQPIDIIVPERFKGAHAIGFGRVAKGGTSKLAGHHVELAAVRASGEEFPVEMLISVWDHNDTRGIGAVLRDLSVRKEQEKRLDFLAHYDYLTRLMNRYHFCELLDEAIVGGKEVSVLLIDINGFRAINDNFGHDRGDMLLQSFAIRLKACLETTMHLARMGGDDFAVLLIGDSSAAYALALDIQAAAAEPFDLNEQLATIGVSVGVSSAAEADLALFAAKGDRRQPCRVFEPYMRERFVSRRELANQLQSAAASNEFVLYYQPQTDLVSGALIGCEALLRWQHPARGLLFPCSFIEELDGNDCSEDVGWWTLDEACRQVAEWDREGLHIPCIGVNLFAKQFRSSGFNERIMATLARHQLTPDRLELELTETLALAQGDASLELLHSVRAQGIRLAFDDFGTGFASLSTLKRIPLTRLKIDKSFVNDLDGINHNTAVVRAVIGIARDLGLSVVAEGIEMPQQVEQLRALGCHEGQGFLFGRGLSPDEFSAKFSPSAAHAA
jgi:diguanylate cyclase (GGDEF)-like protein/PAS domain S-box-containing protein